MSTRGFIGFKTKENSIFGTYNHYDSYYSNAGIKILNIYKNTDKITFNKIFNCIDWSSNDCYNNDINFIDVLNGSYKHIAVSNDCDFLNNGLFCEYGYVYNLENDTLEIYRGLFKEPQIGYDKDSGYEAYDKTKYYVHKVLTLTRESNLEDIEYMFKNLGYNKDKCDIIDGKYIEEIFLENPF